MRKKQNRIIYYLLIGGLSFIFILMGGVFLYAAETCFVEEIHETEADFMYFYLGGNTEQGKSLIDRLIVESPTSIDKENASSQRRGLIFHFCDVLLYRENVTEKQCFDYRSFRYDPRQSLFMYALCVNMDDKGGGKKIAGIEFPKRNFRDIFTNITYMSGNGTFSLSKYLNKSVDKDLNTFRNIAPQESLDAQTSYTDCNPKTTMQRCEFSSFISDIFREVMNTYSNMKLATIYGYKYVQKKSSNDEKKKQRLRAIEDFSHAYFSPPQRNTKSQNNECNTKKGGSFYLNKEDEDGNKKHCSHPKTYKIIDETIKSAQKLLEKVKVLQAEKVILEPCIDMKSNLLSCAFSSTGTSFLENDWTSFENLYMNEFMWYSLFSTYYANEILNTSIYNITKVGRFEESLKNNEREAYNTLYEVKLNKKAIEQTMRWLSNIYTTFPLHIASLAYKEDLLSYRSSISRLYTPLHQLFYLWRNTQSCQE